MKRLIAIACLFALAGCAGARYNTDYARNCGMMIDELGLCNGYQSPHSF